MPSMRSSSDDQCFPDPDSFKAARKYVRDYQDLAIHHLATKCDSKQLLEKACSVRGDSYYRIMSQTSDGEDDTESQSSRRRTLSSNSRTGVTSSSSVIPSCSDSVDGPPDCIWVVPETGSKAPKTLTATRVPQSDCLIQIEAVCSHLQLKYEHFPRVVRYNGGSLPSSGTVAIRWAWSLKTSKVQRSTFYVVKELHSQVVFSDSEPEDSPVDHAVGLSFDPNRRFSPYSDGHAAEKPPELFRHGYSLQQPQDSGSHTADSTTVKPFANRTGQGPRQRQESIASEKSKIPVRKTSGSSFGNQSRTLGGRPPRATHTPTPPPPLAQVGRTSGFTVDILYGECEMGIELELDAPGADFYALLYREIKRKTKRKLNRQTDKVRFTQDKNDFLRCRWVSLEEHRVTKDWEKAANWLRKFEARCDIYAVVGPEPDDDDDDEPPD